MSKLNSKLTPAVQEKFLTAIRQGNFLTAAAGVAGVNRRSIYRWKKQGEAEREEGRNTKMVKFVDALELAEAEAEYLLVNKVMETDRGALEILKRRFRENWGDSIKAEHTGKDGGPIASHTTGSCTLNLTTNMPDTSPFEIDEDCHEQGNDQGPESPESNPDPDGAA